MEGLAAEAEAVAAQAREDADAARRALDAASARVAAGGGEGVAPAALTAARAGVEAAAAEAARGACQAEAAAAALRRLADAESARQRPLRILCLHGYHDSAANLRRKTRRLASLLHKAGLAELVAVDGPFALAGTWTCHQGGPEHAYERRAWMVASVDPPHARVPWEEQTEGLAHAVRGFAEAWNALGPFDGVLGYSQGASLAAAVVALCEGGGNDARACAPPALATPIRFAVLAAGFWAPAAEASGLKEEDVLLRTPSLHILGEADGQVPPRSHGERMAACFRDARIHRHGGGHYFPCDAASIAAVDAFLRERVGAGAGAGADPDPPG